MGETSCAVTHELKFYVARCARVHRRSCKMPLRIVQSMDRYLVGIQVFASDVSTNIRQSASFNWSSHDLVAIELISLWFSARIKPHSC